MQLSDSLKDRQFPVLSEEMQLHTFFEFGSCVVIFDRKE